MRILGVSAAIITAVSLCGATNANAQYYSYPYAYAYPAYASYYNPYYLQVPVTPVVQVAPVVPVVEPAPVLVPAPVVEVAPVLAPVQVAAAPVVPPPVQVVTPVVPAPVQVAAAPVVSAPVAVAPLPVVATVPVSTIRYKRAHNEGIQRCDFADKNISNALSNYSQLLYKQFPYDYAKYYESQMYAQTYNLRNHIRSIKYTGNAAVCEYESDMALRIIQSGYQYR